MVQQKSCSKEFRFQKLLSPIKIVGQKFFESKQILGKKSESKKIGLKNLWVQEFLGPKILGPERFRMKFNQFREGEGGGSAELLIFGVGV